MTDCEDKYPRVEIKRLMWCQYMCYYYYKDDNVVQGASDDTNWPKILYATRFTHRGALKKANKWLDFPPKLSKIPEVEVFCRDE